MINQPEGYLEPNGQGGYDYGYRLKVGAQRKSRLCGNHPSVARQVLGNIRLTFVDFDHNGSIALSEITEEDNYYPFGLKHQGYNSVISSNTNAIGGKIKYNGKELQDDLIGSNSLDWYDYGARFYDPALGRWHVIDNKAEKYYRTSPYTYALNNPIRFIDPDGNEIVDANGNKISYSKEKGWSKNATADVLRINSLMMKSKTGRDQWNKAYSSDNKLRFTIADKDIIVKEIVKGVEVLTLGNAAIPLDFNININGYEFNNDVIDITIFEGSIIESVNGNTENKGMDVDDAMSATVGHEIFHGTNKKNIEQVAENEMTIGDLFKNDVEKVAGEVGNQIRNELKSLVKLESKPIQEIQQ